MDWGRNRCVHLNAGKTQLVLFDYFNNTAAVYVKINRSALEAKLFFKMLGLSFSSKLDCGSYIIFVVKTVSKKLEALIHAMWISSTEAALYLHKSTTRLCLLF